MALLQVLFPPRYCSQLLQMSLMIMPRCPWKAYFDVCKKKSFYHANGSLQKRNNPLTPMFLLENCLEEINYVRITTSHSLLEAVRSEGLNITCTQILDLQRFC